MFVDIGALPNISETWAVHNLQRSSLNTALDKNHIKI